MRALFVPFAPSLAHVSRCLAVAEAWRAAKHATVFAVGKERVDLIRSAGFETRILPEVSAAAFLTCRFRWLTPEYFLENMQAEQEILAEVEPDVVVHGFRFTTTASARLAALPSASIVHGNALRLALHPRETARLLVGEPGNLTGLASLRLRVMRRVFPLIFEFIMRKLARRLAPALKRHSLPAVKSLFEFLLGDEILIADLPGMLPAALPPHAHVVGPLLWSGWAQPVPWLDELDARPLVYVTMGSTVEARSVLARIVDALHEAPYNVVLTTGDISLTADLDLPSQIRVFSTLPGATVMQYSAVALHHGGHETLMQALAAGVPSLMLPVNPDQILVAKQAQSMGWGHSLWQAGDMPMVPRAHTPAEIRRSVDSLIADRDCARNCRTVQQQISASCGASAAAETLARIVQTGFHGR